MLWEQKERDPSSWENRSKRGSARDRGPIGHSRAGCTVSQKLGDTGSLKVSYVLERSPFQLHGAGAGREKDNQEDDNQLGGDYGVRAGDER